MPPNLPAYAELHCLTNYSFLRGASHPEELVRRAADLGYSAIAITDECSLAGVVRAHVAAKAIGLPLIIGAEFKLDDGLKIVALATNRRGYGHLSALITVARRNARKGSYAFERSMLDGGLPDCLVILIPGETARDIDASESTASWIANRFPQSAWLATELLHGPTDKKKLEKLRALSTSTGIPLVAAGDVHMHLRSRRTLQDVLTSIRVNIPLSDCGHLLYRNAERHLRQRIRLANIYPRELLEETLKIAQRCHFSLEELRYEYPEEVVPKDETPSSYLRKETAKGLRQRYPLGSPPSVIAQVDRELELIAEKSYEPYFLTVYDIVRFARDQNILCQGRGSAANSAVCYALGITEVDPARGNLLFERFISRERDEPPDIDIDFEHQRREEVIQYIYARYGRDRTALTATVITYRLKSALRDVGKALGLDPSQLLALTQSLAWWDDKTQMPERLREHGLDPESPLIRAFLTLTATILRFPRHLSQHVGGFVISRGPLSHLVPIENAAMPERTVIQWEKDDLEVIGLMKVDILALGMLSAIRRTLELINQYHGTALGMHDIPPDDQEVYRAIQRADTVGVFQIESRAQMSMLPRLKPKNYYDLVIQVAIVRPGPIQGGMVHPYLRRRQGLETVSYPSKPVESVLERTLGVPIFQEQVMQIAIVAAGFTPGEADQLRRAMAAWRRKGGLEPFEAKLKSGMRARGYPDEFARRIYEQILGFGEYGFPESHSASFALLAYCSAWLKYHHPSAFLAGLLNSQPMGFYAPAQLVRDAISHGANILPPTIEASHWECTLEHGPKDAPSVRLGMRMIKGLSEAAAHRIVAARTHAKFTSIEDCAERAALDTRDLRLLATANAFLGLSEHRRDALWAISAIPSHPHLLRYAPSADTEFSLLPPSEAENIVTDYSSLGLTLGRHPLSLLREKLKEARYLDAASIRELPHGKHAAAAGLVIGRQRPDTASGVIFVTLEDESGCTNVVVWNNIAERQRRVLLGSRLLAVHGVVERDSDVIHLVAKKLVDLTDWLGALQTRSRDFH